MMREQMFPWPVCNNCYIWLILLQDKRKKESEEEFCGELNTVSKRRIILSVLHSVFSLLLPPGKDKERLEKEKQKKGGCTQERWRERGRMLPKQFLLNTQGTNACGRQRNKYSKM